MVSLVRTLMIFTLSLVLAPQGAAQVKADVPPSDVRNVAGKPGASPDDADKPSEAECKAGYPANAEIMGVTRIDYRDIESVRSGSTPPEREPVAELRHGLRINIAALPGVIRLARCGGKPRALVLFLGGRPLPGLIAYPPIDPKKSEMIFLLERRQENFDAWTAVLGRPPIHPMKINVSVGFDDTYPVPSGKRILFRAIPVGWSWTWLGIMVVFAGLFLWAARTTSMLRDRGVDSAGNLGMFSLARVQMAFWTFIILGSFAFIGMITGDYLNSMNEKVLALMGISVGASLGSSIIDSGSTSSAPYAALPTTGSWWRDILSDGSGTSIHRFQLAAWTVVLGIVFLHQVYATLAMPEFNATLLGLLGISAGTYLGLKVVVETPRSVDARAPQQAPPANG